MFFFFVKYTSHIYGHKNGDLLVERKYLFITLQDVRFFFRGKKKPSRLEGEKRVGGGRGNMCNK